MKVKLDDIIDALEFVNDGMDTSAYLNPENLKIVDIDDYTDPKINSVCYKTDAMMEQIIIDNNNLYALFESSAYPYRYSSSSADNLETTDMSLILLPK